MTEVQEQQTWDSRVGNMHALQDEYVATTNGTAKDPSTLGKLFRTEEANNQSYHLKHDSESQGEVLKDFLEALRTMHKSDLTHDQVHKDRDLPFLNDQEKKMMEFTDNHFDQISALQTGKKDNEIDGFDTYQVSNYPNVKREDKAYVANFQEKAAWTGAAIGAVGEVAAFIYAAPAAIMASTYGAFAVGGLVALNKGLVEGAMASAATTVAWGPLIGGFAGYGVGHLIADPVWNMTEGRKINNFYNQMKTSIPTYSEFTGRSNYYQPS